MELVLLFSYSAYRVSMCDSRLAGFQSTFIFHICGWSWANFPCFLGGIPCHCTCIGLELLQWWSSTCLHVAHSNFLRLKWIISMSSNQSILSLKVTSKIMVCTSHRTDESNPDTLLFLSDSGTQTLWKNGEHGWFPDCHIMVQRLCWYWSHHTFSSYSLYGSIIFSWSGKPGYYIGWFFHVTKFVGWDLAHSLVVWGFF